MRVPVILQHSLVECGAACLAMVLGAHGHHTSVRALAEEMGVGRDGVSALTLVRVARARGLTTRALSLPAAHIPEIPLPAVAHWRARHFVVVERAAGDRITIVDPGIGRLRLSREEFARDFSGVVLTFAPGPDFQRGHHGERRSWWSRYARFSVLNHRGILAVLVLLSLILQGLGLVLPTATESVVDRVLGRGEIDLLPLLGLAAAVAALAYLAAGGARAWALAVLRARADTALLDDLARRLLALPFRFFAHRGSADLVSRITGAVVLRDIFTGQVLSTLLDAPLAVGYLVAITVRSPLLGGVLVVLAATQLLVLLVTRQRIRDLVHREHEARNEAQGQLVESVKGIETIKSSGAESQVLERWTRLLDIQTQQARRSSFAQSMQDTALGALRFGAPLALLWAGAWQVVDHRLTVGAMLGVLALAAAALAPLASLTGSLRSLQLARAQAERLADIWETAPESGPGAPAGDGDAVAESSSPAGPGGGARRSGIEMRAVGFRYAPESPWIVRGIDLRVVPGQKVALVGRSGSGKTTLARLLLGLFPPVEGEILYDGVPVSRLDPGRLRRRFGVVTQEPALFTGSIADNIALGSSTVSPGQVEEAARLACVHDDIAAMPLGYHTMLTEGGGLSGGQRQRIALARAILARPEILLLDEATSHLDTDTEAALSANLGTLPQTRIVIAHRLSTIRDADLILALDGGRIVESGTHDALIRSGGLYARLARAQLPAGSR
ncbi:MULTISPECIES: peptidase domain-containing ABC transporter [Streptosporangium]|uniref:ABC-type bacteriocin/lantibiotic exporter with double-glycine peptidase domain n=1 Tax=Streptosporangium brasiliense TaxID=47480 RepID=A0ABT9R2L3_9ACTN|nr:peptidase domain-containing ABC transporter [Streptosporangium brasiliense]MDP9863107.1 ABC-type bacteriocin/lantibiotic exporter with double-glycine peptidase domain [Streptosporangium brasiliense]